MATMDLRVDSEKVAKILEALVSATINDMEPEALLRVLRAEAQGSGLGYMIDDAIHRIERSCAIRVP